MIRLCVPSVHRNPKHWPLSTGNRDNDLEEFKPERWFMNHNQNYANGEENPGESHLFTPQKGSYIPFSDGPRACLGKRFAQVEIVTALAVIFSSHSIELDVSYEGTNTKELSDEIFQSMSKEERKSAWEKAKEKANRTWREKMTNVITLQLSGEKGRVPLRVVRRGEERFFDL
jgi:cytochrome P450